MKDSVKTVKSDKGFQIPAGTTASSKKRRFYGVCAILVFVVDVWVVVGS